LVVCRFAFVISLICSGAVLVAAAPPGAAAAQPDSEAKPRQKKTQTRAAKQKTTTARKASKKSKPKKRKAEHDRTHYVSPADYTAAPAYRYGMMSAAECIAALDARKIPYAKETDTRGVLAPVRVTGALHGVVFRTNLKDAQRATSIWEIADCRLVLALDDFAVILERHGIVDVRHYSMYRSPGKSWPEDKQGTRHNGGLAIDAARFIAKDGSYLDVDRDFNGAIGAKTCGEGAGPRPVTEAATKLRTILCETFDQHIFNFHLTPNYNRPHKNHFHLEVTKGFKSFMAQ
jgi:hypothetical protein